MAPRLKNVGQGQGYWGPFCAHWEDFTATAQTNQGSPTPLFCKEGGIEWELQGL